MRSSFLLRRKLVMALPVCAVVAGCVVVPAFSDIGVLMQEGEELYRAKRYDEAIARFKMVIARDPLNWRAWLWLCRTYIVRALWGDAIEAGRQAFKLSLQGGQGAQGAEVLPVFLQALFGGGAQALTSGNFSESIKHFGEYLKLDGGNVSAWTSVGKAYLGNHQYGDALQSLLKALGMSGVDRGDVVNSILSGGMQAFGQRDYSSAVNLLKEYVKQDPRNLQAYLTLAKSYLGSGQTGGALEAFGQALKINPTNGEALQYLFKLR